MNKASVDLDRSGEGSGNRFARQAPNSFVSVEKDSLSTFGADVDTASYALARRYLNQGTLPPAESVRVEEFVNYFKYAYAPPFTGAFTVNMEGAPSPFTRGRHLLRVGVKGKVVSRSDGDTNIGPHLTADAMLESVGKYVSEGVTLSTIGFGMGNYRDDLMERLADKGNGNCFYIDSAREAKKVFEEKLTGTLEVIAKDVKIQVDFDPKRVKSYRLLGYENRDIADQDFRNDKVDAGEIGAGHTVTALYEVQLAEASPGNLATVRIRAKEPSGTTAREQSFVFGADQLRSSLAAASSDFRFAVAVAGTADVLRHSSASESWSLATAQKLAEGSTDGDPDREEFVRLVARASQLSSHQVASGSAMSGGSASTLR